MNNQISEQDLQNELAKLPQEMSPERDLWPGIERAIQINAQQQTEKPLSALSGRPLAWAASVVAAVLLTWGILTPVPQDNSSPLNLVTVMQQDFEAQKNAMLVSFGQPKMSELPVEMQTQLTQLASARLAIEKALAEDPTNSDLLNLLNWTQKQEISLIKQLYSPQWQTI